MALGSLHEVLVKTIQILHPKIGENRLAARGRTHQYFELKFWMHYGDWIILQVRYRGRVTIPAEWEKLRVLFIDSDLVFLDMTFGAGGHSEAILETFPQCRIIALDRDPACGFYMRQLEDVYPGQLIPLCGRFSELPSLLKKINWKAPIDAILLDAGCSSMQMDQGNRGFAISAPEATLDMRMDGPEKPELISAADIVNRMSEENLTTIFKKYGDEKMAARSKWGAMISQ